MTAWIPGYDLIKATKQSLKVAREAEKKAMKAGKSGKGGEKKPKGVPKNTADSFGEELAGPVNTWFALSSQLKEEKWGEIFVAAEDFMVDLPRAGAGPALREALRLYIPASSEAPSTPGADDFVMSD